MTAVDFTLSKELMTKAMRGEHDGQIEFYVKVEYYKDKKHYSTTINLILYDVPSHSVKLD